MCEENIKRLLIIEKRVELQHIPTFSKSSCDKSAGGVMIPKAAFQGANGLASPIMGSLNYPV